MTIRLAFDKENKTVFSTEIATRSFDDVYEKVVLAETNDCQFTFLK